MPALLNYERVSVRRENLAEETAHVGDWVDTSLGFDDDLHRGKTGQIVSKRRRHPAQP